MKPRDAIELFTSTFDAEPTHFAWAPGRLNLIGDHTDYTEGFVLPIAIDRHITVAARRSDGVSRLVSRNYPDGRPVEFDTAKLPDAKALGWAKYIGGMAWALDCAGYGQMPNIEAAIGGDLPMASAVSSSAAIEMALGALWTLLQELSIDAKQLALLGRRAENEYVGMKCGVMDQIATACGQEDAAMFLDTRTLEIEYVSLPKSIVAMLLDTRTPRELTASQYNQRVAECLEAAHRLGIPVLRDATLDRVKDTLEGDLLRRARHVVTENIRCVALRDALKVEDLEAIGPLMAQSHASLRDDYDASTPALEAMVEAATGSPGCLGARLTGAGFGGACVALVDAKRIEAFERSIGERYERLRRQFRGPEPAFLKCRAAEGARAKRLARRS